MPYKKSTDLSKKSLRYIQNYQKIYRKVISEAKKREADKIISSATKQKQNIMENNKQRDW